MTGGAHKMAGDVIDACHQSLGDNLSAAFNAAAAYVQTNHGLVSLAGVFLSCALGGLIGNHAPQRGPVVKIGITALALAAWMSAQGNWERDRGFMPDWQSYKYSLAVEGNSALATVDTVIGHLVPYYCGSTGQKWVNGLRRALSPAL
jgi:hypothetical protein